MNLSAVFKFLNIVKTLHWITKSHAQHKILDDAFDEFTEKIDEFIECCIGANKIEKFSNIEIEFSIPSEDDIVQMYEMAFDDLITSLSKYANNSGLESLLDDLNNIANKISYLLAMTLK